MNSWKYLSVAMLLFLVSCNPSKKLPKEEKSAAEPVVVASTPESNVDCMELLIEPETYNRLQFKGVKVLEAKIVGNEYIVNCQYSGCPGDELFFAWNGASKKSMPAQAHIKLGFEESGMCESLITKEFCFPLDPFRGTGKTYITVNDGTPVLFEPKE